MSKILCLELSNGNGQCCELDLPAADYELPDALERLRMKPDEQPRWEVLEYYEFEHLAPLLDESFSLCELNALSRRLACLDERQSAAFEGMVQMKIAERSGPIRIGTLVDLAYSTECCHVVGEARNDSQLGRFYAENGFFSQYDNLPEEIFEMLDFERVGRESRLREGGVFTLHGYVVQNGQPKQVFEYLNLSLRKPDYAILLELTHDGRAVPLALPAAPQEMDSALSRLDAEDWSEVRFRCSDCQVPALMDAVDSAGSIAPVNRLAQILARLGPRELPIYKAVVDAVEVTGVNEAVRLRDQLDAYILEPDTRSVEDAAMSELTTSLDEEEIELLLPYLNLHQYGLAVIRQYNSVLTDYGLLERRDGQPILTNRDPVQTNEMEMKL